MYDIWVRDIHKCGVALELHLTTAGDCAELAYFLEQGLIVAGDDTNQSLDGKDPRMLLDKLREAARRNLP